MQDWNGARFFHTAVGVPGLSDGVYCSMIREYHFFIFTLYKVHFRTPIGAEMFRYTTPSAHSRPHIYPVPIYPLLSRLTLLAAAPWIPAPASRASWQTSMALVAATP